MNLHYLNVKQFKMLEKSMIPRPFGPLSTMIRNLGQRVHKRPPFMAAPPIFRIYYSSYYHIIRNSDPSNSKPLLREDADFIYSYEQVVGVADGVGAGDYARHLIKNCTDAIDGASPGTAVDPVRILTDALSRTATAGRWRIGRLLRAMLKPACKAETSSESVYSPLLASTDDSEGSPAACIVSLDGEYLRAAIVGDSGFMIFKGGKYCSYQSSPASEVGVVWSGKIRVAVGDIVVIGTNGFLKNTVDKEIATLLRIMEDMDIVNPAAALANEALSNYSHKFKTHHQRSDITVIVAKLTAY